VHYSNVVYFSLIALVFPIDAVAQESWPTKRWPTATPQSVGLDARELAGFDADLAAGKYGHMDGMLIIRHGKVAYERAY
jgi:hypothetical protein